MLRKKAELSKEDVVLSQGGVDDVSCRDHRPLSGTQIPADMLDQLAFGGADLP